MNKLKLFGLAIAALFTGSAIAADYTYALSEATQTENVYEWSFSEAKNKGKIAYVEVPAQSQGTVQWTCKSANASRYIYLATMNNGTLTKTDRGGVMAKNWTSELIEYKMEDIFVENGISYLAFTTTDDFKSIGIRLTAQAAITTPAIVSMTIAGVEAVIDQDAKTITATLPFGTDKTEALNNATIGLGGTATTSSYNTDYTSITVSDGGTNSVIYTLDITVAATASSEKELLNVTIDGKPITLTEGQGALTVYKNTDVTAMTVAFELSDKATASFTSGSTHDFTNPLVITVTAQDGTTANYTLTVTKAEKTILYLTRNATEGDLMYAAIAAKGYYMEVRANGDNTDFSNYDLVVLHESLDGKAAASGELATLATANVPVLNTKSYFYPSGRWDWGTAANGNTQKFITIPTGEYGNIAQHPIFKGIDLTSNTVNLYNNEVAKNIQPVESFTAGMEGYTLATVEGGTAIHELPAATRVGAEGTAKYILISLLSSQFGDLTAEAQTILANACDYLMGTETWIPQAPEVKSDKKDVLSFSLNGVEGIIDNENRTIAVNYYDFLGAVTSLTANIKVSDYATISENMATAQDYTNPVVFTVTAQDGTTADYTVTVTVSAMPALAKTAMPYVSVMNEAWTTPEWMYLINTETNYNGTYSTTGGKSDAECTVNGGAYRLTKEGKIYMQLEACDSVKVITSGTGDRTYQLEVVGGTATASQKTKKNTKTTTTLVVGSDSPVLICLSTPEAGGGFTFSGVEVYWKEKVVPTAIALDQEAANMTVGQTLTLKVITTPEDANLEGLTWSSSDETMATVANGVVTAVGSTGYDVVTITATLGELTATCDIMIKPAIESIAFTEEMDYVMLFDEYLSISLDEILLVNPYGADKSQIEYTSSNEQVASIEKTQWSASIMFLSAGEATITATVPGTELKAEVTFTILPAETQVTLDQTALTLLLNNSATLVATVTPTTTAPIQWWSEDETIATIDNTGKVTPVAVGTTTIHAQVVFGIEATCQVTVTDKNTGLENIAELDTNAPIYNVLGQEVSAEYKGVVIQNGKKFLLQ